VTKKKVYAVNLWASDPIDNNDDCNTGDDFLSFEEAFKVYQDPKPYFHPHAFAGTVFVEIDGPDVYEKRRIAPDHEPDDLNDWRKEFAMQQGMAFGCQGWNEAIGADLENT